jgi:hypothetical protein
MVSKQNNSPFQGVTKNSQLDARTAITLPAGRQLDEYIQREIVRTDRPPLEFSTSIAAATELAELLMKRDDMEFGLAGEPGGESYLAFFCPVILGSYEDYFDAPNAALAISRAAVCAASVRPLTPRAPFLPEAAVVFRHTDTKGLAGIWKVWSEPFLRLGVRSFVVQRGSRERIAEERDLRPAG